MVDCVVMNVVMSVVMNVGMNVVMNVVILVAMDVTSPEVIMAVVRGSACRLTTSPGVLGSRAIRWQAVARYPSRLVVDRIQISGGINSRRVARNAQLLALPFDR